MKYGGCTGAREAQVVEVVRGIGWKAVYPLKCQSGRHCELQLSRKAW